MTVTHASCIVDRFYLSRAVPPSVMWAQRNNVIFLTICLEDCKNPEIKIDNDKVYFSGVGGTEKKNHEVTIPLFKEIDPEVFIHCVQIDVILHTAFPRLTNSAHRFVTQTVLYLLEFIKCKKNQKVKYDLPTLVLLNPANKIVLYKVFKFCDTSC